MQLSEQKILELARSIPGSEAWSIGCVRFARLLENEILRAQADARPIYQLRVADGAWIDQTEQSYLNNQQHCASDTRIVYTHPEASAPGLSDDAKDLLSAMGFRLVDDFYLRGDVPDDSEESWEVIHRDTVSALSAGAAQLDDDAVYGVLRNYDADMARKTAEAIAHDLRLTRASAATVAEPSPYPASDYAVGQWWFKELEQLWNAPTDSVVTHDMKRAAKVAMDAFKAAQQQAEPSEPWREKLIELADQLDAELTTGVQWSNAQFACFYVSDDLRKIVKKAGGVPNEKDWKTRALEAEKLNRRFMDRWNSENGPTHMGEPVIAAQQQADPGADERIACFPDDKLLECAMLASGQQTEKMREAFEAYIMDLHPNAHEDVSEQRVGDEYVHQSTTGKWLAWQGACKWQARAARWPDWAGVAEPEGWREFITEVAQQKPEKPDYWSSCGQCQRNADRAQDLIAAAPTQQQEGG